MLSRIMACAADVLAADSAEEASRRFFATMEPLGASYLQARVYRRPAARLTSERHLAAGGIVARVAPVTWSLESAACRYVCLECNPLLRPIREGWTRYRFSDFAPHGDRRFGRYWDAMSEAGIADAFCATSYGEDGKIASLHLGFGHTEVEGPDAAAIQMAGLVLTERLMSLCEPVGQPSVRLTERERDSLALVAEGKTDWEISVILGVSEATARFHVDNGRRKLGAVTRAQAVARLMNLRLI
jgi:LuxR family transcriptional regulator, quorum-sensing system regulator BjaR1